jgi:hypothetical protein
MLDLIILITFSQWYKLRSSTLCSLLQPCVTSSVLGPNIFHSTPLSITEPPFFPNVEVEDSQDAFGIKLKFSFSQKQSNPWPTFSAIIAKMCPLLRYKVAKDRSNSSWPSVDGASCTSMIQHQLDTLPLICFIKSQCLSVFRALLAHLQAVLHKCYLVWLRA